LSRISRAVPDGPTHGLAVDGCVSAPFENPVHGKPEVFERVDERSVEIEHVKAKSRGHE
jgi:hypothetical protein